MPLLSHERLERELRLVFGEWDFQRLRLISLAISANLLSSVTAFLFFGVSQLVGVFGSKLPDSKCSRLLHLIICENRMMSRLEDDLGC